MLAIGTGAHSPVQGKLQDMALESKSTPGSFGSLPRTSFTRIEICWLLVLVLIHQYKVSSRIWLSKVNLHLVALDLYPGLAPHPPTLLSNLRVLSTLASAA
ncbi:hypothetical protein SUGI_0832020 [Cryptomeria japonica]|nr:hypothetical protein SUGI_0832020 [Cryptomeria japonica]